MSALIACKTCGKEIAKSAKSCPHCGAPNKKSNSIVRILVTVVAIFVVFVVIGGIFGSKSHKGQNLAAKPTDAAYGSAQALDYRKATLAQIPKETLLSFSGEIVQIVSSDGARISTKQHGNFGFAGDDVFLSFDEKPQLVEKDIVRIHGRYDGTKTYKTVLGAERVVPQVVVDYYKVGSGDETAKATAETTTPQVLVPSAQPTPPPTETGPQPSTATPVATAPPSANETSTDSAIDNKRIAGTYVGHDEGDQEMDVSLAANGRVKLSIGVAVQGCAGSVEGEAELKQNVATYVEFSNNCKIVVTFRENGADVDEGCSYYHGAACGFGGKYTKK